MPSDGILTISVRWEIVCVVDDLALLFVEYLQGGKVFYASLLQICLDDGV